MMKLFVTFLTMMAASVHASPAETVDVDMETALGTTCWGKKLDADVQCVLEGHTDWWECVGKAGDTPDCSCVDGCEGQVAAMGDESSKCPEAFKTGVAKYRDECGSAASVGGAVAIFLALVASMV